MSKMPVSSDLKDRALASAAEGITISDPSLPDNPLIYVNSGFEQMTGYTADEVLGRNCRFLQGPQTGKTAAETIRKAIREDRPCIVEILNYRKDGSTFWNRLSMTPVKNNRGITSHFIGVQSDITRRKQAEEDLLRAKEEVERANEGMKQALRSAAKIQRALLPEKPICTPDVHIFARLIACEELAGDTLNYFRLDPTHIGCYVLDVVGHGISAALYSVALSHFLSPVSVKSFLYASPPEGTTSSFLASPEKVAEELNRAFLTDAKTAGFFTLLYGIFDTQTHVFEYVSAGHPYVIHQSADGTARLQQATGFPIGIVENPGYESARITPSPGDRLFLYSDGLIEVCNAQDQMLGEKGLCRILEDRYFLPLHKAIDAIIRDIRQFAGQDQFQDDVSILAVQIPGRIPV